MTAYGKAIAVEVAVEDNQRYASNRLKTVRRIVAGCVAAFAGDAGEQLGSGECEIRCGDQDV